MFPPRLDSGGGNMCFSFGPILTEIGMFASTPNLKNEPRFSANKLVSEEFSSKIRFISSVSRQIGIEILKRPTLAGKNSF